MISSTENILNRALQNIRRDRDMSSGRRLESLRKQETELMSAMYVAWKRRKPCDTTKNG